MSASFLVFMPVALLFIVSGLCFVGCSLDTRGHDYVPPGENPKPPEPKPPVPYSNDVLDEISIAAYWPLNEPAPADPTDPKLPAHDAAGAHDGVYKHKDNFPELFDCPAIEIGMSGIHSAFAVGFLSLGQINIVPGDLVQPPSDPPELQTGMQVNGAFVSVPLPAVVTSATFTVEAWVRPEWDANEIATRVIVDSRGNAGALTGFVLWANEDGKWEGVINGTNGGFVRAISTDTVALGEPTHVVLTFDGADASIFVNGAHSGGPFALLGSTFTPNTTHDLIIGAGFNFLPERTAANEDQAFPLIPFNGTIQNVAIYSTVLPDSVINTHYYHGKGQEVPAG